MSLSTAHNVHGALEVDAEAVNNAQITKEAGHRVLERDLRLVRTD
jgi:hypothetical protein